MPILRLASSARSLRFMRWTGCSPNQYSPAPLIVEQGQHVQQRRLARAGRSHDGDELAFLDGEVNAAQYPGLARSGLVAAFDVF